MQRLDGRSLAAQLQRQLAQRVHELKQQQKPVPHLAAILVGDDAASRTYVKAKIKACAEIGINSSLIHFDQDVSEQTLIKKICDLNNDPTVHGILLQLPLPGHLNAAAVMATIAPEKDVDGFHVVNAGKLLKGMPAPLPATPYGILLLLQHYRVPTEGKHCVIVGRSDIVGRPLSILLSRNAYPGNCTVTLCHSKTQDLAAHCRCADLLVAAIGKPNFITADMVKPGAVVIDVGINRIADSPNPLGYRLVGDVDFERVAPLCSYITPVPGGVGPMTIAALLLNTFHLAGYPL
ncbi:MAG: bifunctional methylenetetrahydrofolate dehydrogenase/methenyltetrahydrofolate cyclohydrolase FolD [Chitinophagales bacterium]|nr:bifunctional methylenetetrahydrofolate dehydrogenase/methenyltetrahydrofolate cyclohydrolase FolD [Chitinophagales bacterium]MDW8427076.1 bifunctional methylenetetrahydrofolate dehydrogenase/methenyltetrahydrofolate cyclohydrolase FolD [Chitinophagales bacterium]